MSLFSELKRRNVIRVGIAYTVTSWLLIQVAETIFPLFGFDDTPARIVVIVLAIGFVPTLVLAWILEVTPEGIRTDSEAQDLDASPEKLRATRRFDRIVMAVLVVAVVYFAVDKFVFDPIRDQELIESENVAELVAPSIAVLPFVDMSANQDQEYFSDGIAETLLHVLTGIRGLQVAARTSSFAYKGKNVPVGEIGETLDVNYVLEGSVRRSDDTLRITAQLIETNTGYHIWSKTYDQPFDDIFVIQDTIASSVADSLEITLLNEVRSSTARDPEVYATYLQAQHLHQQFNPDAMQGAMEKYLEVATAEPDYSGVWTNLGRVYTNLVRLGSMPAEEGYRLAREAAEKELLNDPLNANAYDLLGWIAMYHSENIDQALSFYEKAVELDSRGTASIGNAGTAAMEAGMMDKAVELMELHVMLDPSSSISNNNLAIGYYFVGQYEEAERVARLALQFSADLWGGRYRLGRALLFQGKFEEALAEFEAEVTDEEYKLKGEALSHYALGQNEIADAKLAELVDKFATIYPDEIAHVYAYRGEVDNAFEILETMSEPSGGRARLRESPFFEPLKSDERWQEVLEKHNATDEVFDQFQFNPDLSHRF